nr:hypothetical protein [uncultured Cetobacterium sp.]
MSLEKLSWNLKKFKEFEKFIEKFESKSNIIEFAEKTVEEFKEKEKKEIVELIKNMTEEEQLLLLYLRSLKRKRRNTNSLERDYLEFCENYYKNLRGDLYEQKRWDRQLLYNLGSKRNLLIRLNASRIVL